MSRQPSPGPNQSAHIHGHVYQGPSASATSSKQKSKSYVAGITAGVEDVKYQAKYKELKKKVKEIELDNDRLYMKLLLAKKNIRRMNLERAILYERLAAVPPTPGRPTQDLPPEQDPIFAQHQQIPHEHGRMIDVNDHAVAEYLRAHPNAQVMPAPDGRVVAIEVPPVADTRVPVEPSPPHGIAVVQGFRHESGPGYDPVRQLPPLPPSAMAMMRETQQELPVPNNRGAAYHSGAYPPPAMNNHAHTSSSHHSRTSSRPDLDQMQGDNSRLEAPPPVHTVHSRGSSLSGEGQPDSRSRRHDMHELPHLYVHNLPHQHVQIPNNNLSPESPSLSPITGRSSGRLHNHQRVGPGANVNRERDPELDRDLLLEREKERERDRERERELAVRTQMAMEEEARGQWLREDAGLIGPGMGPGRSRSDTPASGSGHAGSGGPSRPTSGQSYERERDRDRSRLYAPRVSNLLVDQDSHYDAREDRVSGSGSTSRGSMQQEMAAAGANESRKRSRSDMEVSEERSGELHSPSAAISEDALTVSQENRGSKRVHEDDDINMSPAHVSAVRDERLMDEDD